MNSVPFSLTKTIFESIFFEVFIHAYNISSKFFQRFSYFHFRCMFKCLPVYLCTACVQCPLRPGQDVKTPGSGFTGNCEPLCGCCKLNLGPLREQPVFLTTEPSLQPLQRVWIISILPAHPWRTPRHTFLTTCVPYKYLLYSAFFSSLSKLSVVEHSDELRIFCGHTSSSHSILQQEEPSFYTYGPFLSILPTASPASGTWQTLACCPLRFQFM